MNKKFIPKEINLIFDGGAFNGGFAAGIALYLKCMETNNLLKIRNISGCSIGSVLAVWYLTGCNPDGIAYFEKFMLSYKKNMNLHAYKTIVTEFMNSIFAKKEDESAILLSLNGYLFITFYNIKTHRQKTVSKFRDKAHLIDCILRSSHIPYMMDGRASYKKKYMDGISPHIFNNGLPSLFIKLLTLSKCTRSLMIKSENNIHYRLLTGVADVNNFFTTGRSDMCSFTSDWSYSDIFQLRIREMVCFYIFSLISWLIVLKNYLPVVFTKSLFYNGTVKAVNGLYGDLVGRILL